MKLLALGDVGYQAREKLKNECKLFERNATT